MSGPARHRSPAGGTRTVLPWLVTLLMVVLVAAGAVALWATGALDRVPLGQQDPSFAAEGTPSPTPTPTPTPTPPPDAVFTLVAAGDVLPHHPVLRSARTAEGHDFAPLLAPIQPWVAGADLALCHLEVPVAPPGTQPSGYPVFGAPAAVVAGLAANGWDGCSTASNHSMDRGAAGIATTLEALDAAGLGHVGTARDATEASAPQLYELVREGQTITVAHIAATYGTNGIPVPADAPWSVTLIDTAAMVEQARQARATGADVVVASVHCCVEYVSEATEEQRRIATELGASGQVDLLIGHHAHVPQQLEVVPGGPLGEGMWVAHGLGNLISNQDGDCCTPRTESGLLVTATLRKPADEPVRVTGMEWTGVTVDRAGGHRVHALPDLLAGSAAVGGAPPEVRQQRVAEVVGTQAPQRTAPPQPTGPEPSAPRRPQASAVGTG